MDQNQTNTQAKIIEDQYFEVKGKSSITFDLILWIFRILKNWHLFVISIILCLGIAHLKNKSWVPVYSTQALVMLEGRGNTGIVNAVPLGNILRNEENQQIILRSYGMTERTVRSLPDRMRVNYFRANRFKTVSLYSNTPLKIEVIGEHEPMYNLNFVIEPIDENKCFIFKKGSDKEEATNREQGREVVFGKVVDDKNFNILIEKTETFTQNFEPFCFGILSDGQLIGMYNNRVQSFLLSSKASALQIGIAGVDPQRDIDYLNTLLQEFEDYNLMLKNKQADLTISFLTKQIDLINDSLLISRKALDKFQKETGIYAVSSERLFKEMEKADDEKDQIALREKSLLILSQKISDAILDNSKLLIPSQVGLEHKYLNNMIEQYNAIIERSRYIGPKNPLYNKTTDELNQLRTKILKELQASQSELQIEKDIMVEKFQLLDLKIENLPPQERDLVLLQREYRINEVYHQFLTQKRYEAQIQKASNTPDNFVWEEPRITSGPNNGGETGKNYMFWFILGALVPLAYVIIKEEVLNNTISTKEECENLSGLPVLGTIENISNKLKQGVVLVKNYPKSSFAESFRNIRVRLEYMAQKENNITVLVTSAEPADGKTFIATNIASVYQLMDKKVVIVDLDLRRPSVSKTLAIGDREKGVSNYLINQVGLDEIIYTHPDYGFDVITAGTLPPNPSELIKTEKTKELIEKLQSMYDFVIIDCSPVGLVSDAYILANYADTTLFAVRRAKTNRAFFKSVVTQLREDGISNVALVFNDVKGREGYYGTSRYYGDKSYYLKKSSYYHDDYFEN